MRKSGRTKSEKLVRELLASLGENPDREGLQKTPLRVAKMYEFLTKGYHEDVKTVLNGAVFKETYSEMVIVRDIDFFSLCEHHLLPFYGRVHVAYIPNGKIIGLSKIPRVVEVFARRLQVQERMTQQIAQSLFDHVKPQGVAVVIEARHLCMIMRGVEKQNSTATTSSMLGVFRDDVKTRSEFLTLINREQQQ
jgi:GTP cyclohydrolase IA